ncbi:hypothetical protein LLH03_07905 [bacterium]|nr:hypothetical protein [bacterium]
MQEWTDLASLMTQRPEAAEVIAGALVALVVQMVKSVWKLPPGGAKWQKLAVAMLSSVLLTWARQCLTPEYETAADLLMGALVTWSSSTLAHSVAFRQSGGKGDTASGPGMPATG